jgi:hypothetical protein
MVHACVFVVSLEEDEPLALLQQSLGLLGQHHRLGLVGVEKRRREREVRGRDEGRGGLNSILFMRMYLI